MSFFLSGCWRPSQHLRRQGDDLHELLLPQLAADGPEDAGPDRLAGLVDDDRGVVVEADVGAVLAADLLAGPDDDGPDDLALGDLALGVGLLDRGAR